MIADGKLGTYRQWFALINNLHTPSHLMSPRIHTVSEKSA